MSKGYAWNAALHTWLQSVRHLRASGSPAVRLQVGTCHGVTGTSFDNWQLQQKGSLGRAGWVAHVFCDTCWLEQDLCCGCNKCHFHFGRVGGKISYTCAILAQVSEIFSPPAHPFNFSSCSYLSVYRVSPAPCFVHLVACHGDSCEEGASPPAGCACAQVLVATVLATLASHLDRSPAECFTVVAHCTCSVFLL